MHSFLEDYGNDASARDSFSDDDAGFNGDTAPVSDEVAGSNAGDVAMAYDDSTMEEMTTCGITDGEDSTESDSEDEKSSQGSELDDENSAEVLKAVDLEFDHIADLDDVNAMGSPNLEFNSTDNAADVDEETAVESRTSVSNAYLLPNFRKERVAFSFRN